MMRELGPEFVMTDLVAKKLKFETVGEFTVITSLMMDDEEDLLAWTRDLATFAAADEADVSAGAGDMADNPPANFTNHNPDNPNSSAGTRKRHAWAGDCDRYPDEGHETPSKRAPRCVPESNLTSLTPLADAQSPVDVKPDPNSAASHQESSSGGDDGLQLWGGDPMDTLPAGFDNSLAGLTNNPYNINESMLSSPSLTFKQEEPSGEGATTDSESGTLHRLLQQTTFAQSCPRPPDADCRFQYVLAAATSLASKQGEETLTYLNQGQSYGIKLKKVGELLAFKGKLLKTVVRVHFHERRLQYSEKEQIVAWQASRPGERIVELDVPLSYGLCEVQHDPTMVNTLTFCWDPTQEVGAYIKVNSISTEFTPKKHGGEKGVPFRLQLETYIEGDTFRLHAAACQIRVFKLKGADRKHKQEKEKWLKLPESERAKYQASYDSTVLSDLSPDAVVPPQPFVSNSAEVPSSPTFPPARQPRGAAGRGRGCRNATLPVLPDAADLPDKLEEPAAPQPHPPPPPLLPRRDVPQVEMGVALCREQVTGWLMGHGFESVSGTFAEYNGTDMMRLTREDLVTMCGLPNGTRLFYALRSKPAIRVVVYVSVSGKNYYNALYLKSATAAELASQLAQLLQLPQLPEKHMFLLGPANIHIVVSDDVVANITSETAFLLQLLKDEESERCCVLLRTTSSPPAGQ